MKKLILTLTAIFTLAIAAIGFAADGGEAYDVLKKQVQERFGRLKESKFYSFQRYDNVDYVTYIGSFSKEKLVSITFAFNKENKMTDFALSPMQQNAEQK